MIDEPTPLDLIALCKPGYEVWASERTTKINGRRVPKLLIAIYEEGQEPSLTIIDPQTNDEVFSADDYLEIIDCLCEHEYELVAGQMEICSQAEDEDD